MFRSKVDAIIDHMSCYLPTGDGIEKVMGLDKEGKPVITGKKFVYREIQAEKDLTDINVMMQRFRNGDLDVFNQREGAYIDTTDYPTSLAELHARIVEANDLWNMLSDDEKSNFESMSDFLDKEGTYLKKVIVDSDKEGTSPEKVIVNSVLEGGENK